MKTAFVYSDKYFAYDYGASHPLKIERLRMTHDLCKAYHLFDLPGTDIVETRPASDAEILRFHSSDYVHALQRASCGEINGDFRYGLGAGDNPVFPGVWEWSCLHAGASIQCAQRISGKKARVAFNIAGGLHHAGATAASGFCYVNDPVLAIYHFLDQGYRVMYIDVDAHHGDGVQWAFYEDPGVLTVSFHQDGRTLFPGTGALTETGRGKGRGYSVNVPMLPGTDDHVFWEGFRSVVPLLIEQFNPDVVVAQLGVDTFRDDPLAALELTTNGFCRAVAYLNKQSLPWVALGGGGYNLGNVARAWTLAWAIMNSVDLPDDIPEAVRHLSAASGTPWQRLRDQEHESPFRQECLQHMGQCLKYLEKNVFPKIS